MSTSHAATEAPVFLPTRCAVCETPDNADELYPATLRAEDLNPAVFSARRPPDRVHYRLVRCRGCGLVRSDPVAPPELVDRLYARSRLTYGPELPNLRRTYAAHLRRLDRLGARPGAFLEVGCGNGFLLEEARRLGYARVAGVEPSRAAVALAPPEVRRCIVQGVFRPGLFPRASFDVIGFFQVFDHLPDPGAALDECRRLLRPGGLVVLLQHNVGAVSARLLGERSPIVDVEHTYLYSPATLARLLARHGFRPLHWEAVWNRYSLGYLARLLPLPPGVKRAAGTLLDLTGLGRLNLAVPLGNMVMVARVGGAEGGGA